MTTPTGTSPSSRATRSAADSRAAPTIAESGRTRRAAGPTSSRTTWGTTRPTNPMSPLIATPAAVASEARASRMPALAPDVDAEVARGRVAEQQPVERPGAQRR